MHILTVDLVIVIPDIIFVAAFISQFRPPLKLYKFPLESSALIKQLNFYFFEDRKSVV